MVHHVLHNHSDITAEHITKKNSGKRLILEFYSAFISTTCEFQLTITDWRTAVHSEHILLKAECLKWCNNVSFALMGVGLLHWHRVDIFTFRIKLMVTILPFMKLLHIQRITACLKSQVGQKVIC